MTVFKHMWLALAALCCAVAAGAWLDARMKETESWGYAPVDSQFQIIARDLPGAWRAWQKTPTGQAVETNLSRQLHDVALGIRKSTGIRPTPLRVSAWLGQRALVGMNITDPTVPQWGLCVHPGLLLHMGHTLNRLFGAAPVGDVFRLYDWHYAWRDGFLIASLSEDYVMDALASDAPMELADASDAGTTIQWQGEHAGHLALHADNDLSFEAQWRGTLPAQPHMFKSEVFPDVDPDAIFSLSGGTPTPYLQWLASADRLWHEPLLKPALEITAPWWTAWGRADALSKMDVDAYNFSLNGIDLAQQLPIPVCILSLHTPTAQPQHPFFDAVNCAVPTPYAWNEHDGMLLPLAGPAWTLALQGKNRVWHCTGQEAAMHRFLLGDASKPIGAQPPQGDFRLSINWPRLGECAGALANYAANNELLVWNARELPEKLSPWLDFLKSSGHFEFIATAEKDHVVVFGHLNRQVVKP